MTMFRTLIAGLLATISVHAQTTHLVGPNGLPQINDALAVASPGDVIQVEPGTYGQFTMTFGVTIRALQPNSVDIDFDPALLPAGCPGSYIGCEVDNDRCLVDIPADQTANLIGLHFLASQYQFFGPPAYHRVELRGGNVRLAECEIESLHESALIIEDSVVHMDRCTVRGLNSVLTGRAVFASQSTITATNCTWEATQVTLGFTAPGEGILLLGSTLHANNMLIRGGTAATGLSSNAIQANNSRVWVCDSAIEAGPFGCPIGTFGGFLPRFDRCTVIAQAFGCGVPEINNTMIAVSPEPGPFFDSFYSVNIIAAPSAVVAILASPTLAVSQIPDVVQPSYLGLDDAFVAAATTTGSFGNSAATWIIPDDPAVLDLELWFQAFSLQFPPPFPFPLPMAPIEASPLFGGVVR